MLRLYWDARSTNIQKNSCRFFISCSGAISRYLCENVRSRTGTSEFEIVTYCEVPVDKTLLTNLSEIGCQILYCNSCTLENIAIYSYTCTSVRLHNFYSYLEGIYCLQILVLFHRLTSYYVLYIKVDLPKQVFTELCRNKKTSAVRTVSVAGTFVFLISFSAVTMNKAQTCSDFKVDSSL